MVPVAPRLKDAFGADVVRAIAADLHAAWPALDARAFTRDCLRGFDALELTQRAHRVAEVMHAHLPAGFEEAADVIVRSLGPEREHTARVDAAPFRYLPHGYFVGRYGLDHFEASMRAQHELTRRFTAEFSIRPFLVRHREATLARLEDWARDPNVHVRRLVSEGTRPRLPWAPRLRVFQEDPAPVLRLLELLRDDPERYVQRSVANNLNDIGKDHPGVAAETCRRWAEGAPPGRAWIVRHALRSLVKRGDGAALATLGYAARPRVAVRGVRIAPGRAAIGGRVEIAFEIRSRARVPQALLVDLVVHFVKASGATRARVFKLRRVSLPAGGREALRARLSLVQRSTRTHRPGRHAVDARVNGVDFSLGSFEIVDGAGETGAGVERRLSVRRRS